MTFRYGGPGSFFDNSSSEDRPARRFSLPVSKKTLTIGALLLFLLLGLPALASFLVDYYWFQAEGLSSVFWTQLLPQWVLLGLFGLLAFGMLATTFLMARSRSLKLYRSDSNEWLPLLRSSAGKRILLAIALFLAIRHGSVVMNRWTMILQFFHGTTFNQNDAIFGRDIGFYIFTLPFLAFLRSWLLEVLLLALTGTAIIYATGLIPSLRQGAMPEIPQAAKTHVLSLAALGTLLWGASFWLQRYELLYSPRGVGFGASYTDIHVDLLALNVLAILAALTAAALVVAIKRNRSWRFVAVTLLLLVGANVVLRGVLPSLVEKYIVEPNQFEKERPYMQYNIAATLQAYGLDKIKTADVTPEPLITRHDVDGDPETLENIRLWDERALLRSYKQLQEIRTYYDFSSVDIDRYSIGGRERQVMLGVRELDLSGLQNPSWVNSHLEFTHGYGLVMNPAGEVAKNGQPVFWIRDLPPRISVPLTVERPEIYFGEAPSTYAFVNTTVKEFDYPMGDSNARSSYQGTGGAPIGSLWRQLVYALALNDSKIIFSNVFTDESRIMYRRNIRQRLQIVAPFLLYDSDPYIALVDGRLVWIVDGYTTSQRFPYSEPTTLQQNITNAKQSWRQHTTLNYIRNSVKATVDAYDGSMKFYISDESDPLIRTWSHIFPGLFKPLSDISADLRSHLRYPENLFSIQADVYRTYHMKDPNTFYNKEDVWNTPRGSDAVGVLGSYYVNLKLQNESKAEFMLMAPYTPVGRDNMIAWMTGRSDGDNYGELLVYQFPKQTLIYGPNQVAALINQTPEISAQLSLWTQRGSDVIRGHLLVIPVGNSLLYVQPLYLKAERSDLPELKRIILSSGGRVVWDETFEGALRQLLNLTDSSIAQPPVTDETTADRTEEQPSESLSSSQNELVAQALTAWEEGQDALKTANWQNYGLAMKRLEEALKQLLNTSDKAPALQLPETLPQPEIPVSDDVPVQ